LSCFNFKNSWLDKNPHPTNPTYAGLIGGLNFGEYHIDAILFFDFLEKTMTIQVNIFLPDDVFYELKKREPQPEKQSELIVEALRYFFTTHTAADSELEQINRYAEELDQETERGHVRWIYRIDNLLTHTYSWKVGIRRRNERRHKYFSDSVYGSKDAALKAAIAYRDTLLQNLSGVDYSLWRRDVKRPNNTSGLIGVGRYVARSKNSPTEHPYWQAFWRDAEGKRCSRTFMISQYGENMAKERAIEARREGIMEVERVLKSRLEKKD
jgi:hypothetical protein